MRDFYELEKLQIIKKGLGEFVTNSDTKAESILLREICYFKPYSNFLLEERGEVINDETDPARWIIDAIDGTANFMRGNPNFCTSIALEDLNEQGSREIVACVIYCPVSRELYWAEKGKGAYAVDNAHVERRIKVSSRTSLLDVVGSFNSALVREAKNKSKALEAFNSNQVKLRISGAMALDMAYVASGRFDFCMHDKLKIWDVASGSLLIREAGGIVSDFDKQPIEHGSSMLASNAALYPELIEILSIPS